MLSNTNINPITIFQSQNLITKHIKINNTIGCKIKGLSQHHSNININPINVVQS
jgi:hypothetical protein